MILAPPFSYQSLPQMFFPFRSPLMRWFFRTKPPWSPTLPGGGPPLSPFLFCHLEVSFMELSSPPPPPPNFREYVFPVFFFFCVRALTSRLLPPPSGRGDPLFHCPSCLSLVGKSCASPLFATTTGSLSCCRLTVLSRDTAFFSPPCRSVGPRTRTSACPRFVFSRQRSPNFLLSADEIPHFLCSSEVLSSRRSF